MNQTIYRSGLRLISLIALPLAIQAQDNPADTTDPIEDPATTAPYSTLEEFAVIGSSEAVFELPGSAYYIDEEQLTRFNSGDITRILREVPGVYIRPEDGYGQFPNISIRGVDGGRSSKLTILEDGVLAAPAAYSAPAAYFTPTVARMHALEVLKGSGLIQYGPQTSGGVINFISTPVPETFSGFGRFSYGSYNDYQTHLWVGGKEATDYGKVGVLLEFYNRQTDGFKKIDSTLNSDNSNANTGFNRKDYNVKLTFEPNWQRYNYFEFNAGYVDFDTNETYLGLSTTDLRNDFRRRYAISRFDQLNSYRTSLSLRHIVELSPDSKLTSTAYYTAFNRNWYKLHDINVGGGSVNPSWGLFPGTAEYDLITGTGSGSYRMRANNRAYTTMGFQSRYDATFETGPLTHFVEAGIRVHYDSEKRFQRQDTFTQDAVGDVTGIVRGVDGAQDNRLGSSLAFAAFIQDRIDYQDWSLIPGLRFERIFQQNQNYNAGTDYKTDYNTFAPGVALEYRATDKLTTFAGYHRGFALPTPSSSTNPASHLRPETSDNFEFGARYHDNRGLRAELIGFYTLYNNLIAQESIGGGISADANVGKALARGFEALIGIDPARLANQGFNTPLTLAFTYTDAQLRNDVTSVDPESPFAGGRKGNRLPYIAPYQINLTAGIEYQRIRGYASLNWVASSWASATNTDAEEVPVGPDAGTPDARFGKIDSYTTVDLSIYYRVWRDVELFAYANNVFDERYLASRLPQGPRPGAGRMLGVGVQARF